MLAGLCWFMSGILVVAIIQGFQKGSLDRCIVSLPFVALSGGWAVYFTLRMLNCAHPKVEREIFEEDPHES